MRVSFFGGGTDYPAYFERHPGAVIGMAIDRYIYVSALRLSDIIDYKYRVSYSRLERTNCHDDIEHPVVRTVLSYYGVDEALDISIQSDLPASSGLGSSSAFTVGLVNLVTAFKRQSMTRLDLGRAAIHVEQSLLRENVGVQDQLHAAFGGMNRFDFVDGRIRITPVQMSSACLDHLLASLVLVYTGRTRLASQVVSDQVTATRERKIDRELSHLLALVTQAVDVLEGDDPEAMLRDFGAMMHEGWQTKRQLSAGVSSPEIDTLYDAARSSGAIGGKLCGAGGGGFLLMVVPPSEKQRFAATLKSYCRIPVGMDRLGSVIISG
ncbi:GHMP kinase [Rhodopseudomonas palustris]|nr:GHMP kinase [Rhodopseudomonas palustris]